jgi:type IV pilus assembly protein PilO
MSLISSIKRIDFRNTKVQAVLIITLSGMIGAALYFQYYLVPKKEEIKNLSISYKKKQNELNKILSMKTHLEELRKNVAIRNAKLDSLRSIFPDKKEIPQLIHNITKLAHKTGILTVKFNPLQDVVKEFYIENIYTMSVIGGYHELASFFNYLAELDLIINLSDVSIRTNPGIENSIIESKDHNRSIHSIIATFSMTTFSSKK